MDRWYISDTHFHHYNIIKYCDRPFADVKEMDEALVQRWNEIVKPEDHISHLGDVTMERGGRVAKDRLVTLIKSLNGHKRLYLGNHDHFPIETYLEAGFEKVYATWRSQENIIFSHIPIHPDSLGSAIANVHGHTHDAPEYPAIVRTDKEGKSVVKPYVNICVEKTLYRPIHIDEIMQRIKNYLPNRELYR